MNYQGCCLVLSRQDYHSKLYTFLSLSACHFGFMDQQSPLFNSTVPQPVLAFASTLDVNDSIVSFTVGNSYCNNVSSKFAHAAGPFTLACCFLAALFQTSLPQFVLCRSCTDGYLSKTGLDSSRNLETRKVHPVAPPIIVVPMFGNPNPQAKATKANVSSFGGGDFFPSHSFHAEVPRPKLLSYHQKQAITVFIRLAINAVLG